MLKILVAEDDRNLAHYYETLLSQWDCETVVEHTRHRRDSPGGHIPTRCRSPRRRDTRDGRC